MLRTQVMRTQVKRIFRLAGLEVHRSPWPRQRSGFPFDFEPDEIDDVLAVRPFTMTTPARIVALVRAVRYLVANHVPGDMVECGVWKGGSMMAIARTLLRLGDTQRHLYLFDTYDGMSRPDAIDVAEDGEVALETWQASRIDEAANSWCRATLEEVREAVLGTGYPAEKIHFVRGRVEDTLPAEAPDAVALLRLDTDWYESTRHELEHLYPRLVQRGVILIDDYGFWQGARRATDEYLTKHKITLLLNRIDETGRIGVKT